MKNKCFCSFCSKDLTDLVQYHPGNYQVYCNPTCFELSKHSEIVITHPKAKPFDKEFK